MAEHPALSYMAWTILRICLQVIDFGVWFDASLISGDSSVRVLGGRLVLFIMLPSGHSKIGKETVYCRIPMSSSFRRRQPTSTFILNNSFPFLDVIHLFRVFSIIRGFYLNKTLFNNIFHLPTDSSILLVDSVVAKTKYHKKSYLLVQN